MILRGFDELELLMSSTAAAKSLLDYFSALKDPRQGWRVVYPLREVLLLVLCASLCGMDDFVEIGCGANCVSTF